MLRYDLYMMKVDYNKNCFCYSCRGFGHLARNCKNKKIIVQGRKLKYGDNLNNINSNLDKEKSLVVLN